MTHRQSPGFQQRPEVLLEVDVLASAERNRGRRRNAPVLIVPLPRHRVLHPGEIVFFQPPGQPDAVLHRDVAEMVDRNRDLVSGHFTHVSHILVEIIQSFFGEMDAGESVRGVEEVVGLAAHRPRIDRAVRRREYGLLVLAHLFQEAERSGETPLLFHQKLDPEIHFEEGVPLLHPIDQRPAHVAPAALGVGVAVDPDPIAELPAQQLPDRFAERFAEDVPAGKLDSGDGGGLDHAALPETLADQHLHEVSDPGGILTDDQILQVAQSAEDGVVVAFERRFAETGDPFVGVDEKVEVVPVGEQSATGRGRPHKDRFDTGYFHAFTSFRWKILQSKSP